MMAVTDTRGRVTITEWMLIMNDMMIYLIDSRYIIDVISIKLTIAVKMAYIWLVIGLTSISSPPGPSSACHRSL